MRTSSGALLLLILLPPAGAAAQAAPDPSATLFDPVPSSQLRAFTPDRPGASHSPITVDAGHIQLESDIVNQADDHWSLDNSTTRTTILGDPQFRIGLLDWAEFDAMLPVYERMTTRQRPDGPRQTATGQGDLALGTKINLWGNNPRGDPDTPGQDAFGLVATLQLPTASTGLGDGGVEATIDAPYTITLPQKFSLTLDPGVGVLREADKNGSAGDVRMIASLSRPVIGDAVIAMLELVVDHSADRNTGDRDTFDPSLAWQIGHNLQLDAGAFIGLTKAATDANPYIGITVRY